MDKRIPFDWEAEARKLVETYKHFKALGEEMYALAEREGLLGARRMDYITDGEPEPECIFQDYFAKNLPATVTVVRVQDAMHSCGYVDAVVKVLERDVETAKKRSRKLRKRLVDAGWDGFLKSFRRVAASGAGHALALPQRPVHRVAARRHALASEDRRMRKEGGKGKYHPAAPISERGHDKVWSHPHIPDRIPRGA